MEACSETYKHWQQVQLLVEGLQEACDEQERRWEEDFFLALDNLADPESFLKTLLRSRKGFEAYLLCKQDYEHILRTDWAEAVGRLQDCVEDYAHQDIL